MNTFVARLSKTDEIDLFNQMKTHTIKVYDNMTTKSLKTKGKPKYLFTFDPVKQV